MNITSGNTPIGFTLLFAFATAWFLFVVRGDIQYIKDYSTQTYFRLDRVRNASICHILVGVLVLPFQVNSIAFLCVVPAAENKYALVVLATLSIDLIVLALLLLPKRTWVGIFSESDTSIETLIFCLRLVAPIFLVDSVLFILFWIGWSAYY